MTNRIYFIAILSICLVSCNRPICSNQFSTYCNSNLLSLWEKKTNEYISTQKVPYSKAIFDSASKDKISLFDRAVFFYDLRNLEYDRKFDSFIVLEINRSGEFNSRIKNIFTICENHTEMLTFIFDNGRWNLTKQLVVNKDKLHNALTTLQERKHEKSYWNADYNDLISISTFADQTVNVKVFDTLDKNQYHVINNIEKFVK